MLPIIGRSDFKFCFIKWCPSYVFYVASISVQHVARTELHRKSHALVPLISDPSHNPQQGWTASNACLLCLETHK